MKRAVITGSKNLAIRKDLTTDEAIKYLTSKDVFYADDKHPIYGRDDLLYYPAKTKYGSKGYVLAEGVILKEVKKVGLNPKHRKTSSSHS